MSEIPEMMKVLGINKNLDAILDQFVGNWKVKSYNRAKYRELWQEFLPKESYNEETKIWDVIHEPWSVAYVPQVAIRVTMDNSEQENKESVPYFIMVLNNARDSRPQTPLKDGVDLLQQNIIDKGMIIAKIDDFLLCPNGFPYHDYASLLISERPRRQEKVTAEDITTWIKFSFLTDQYVFFNSLHAGASRPERFHAQVVDPDAIHYEGKSIDYPIINAKRNKVRGGVYEIDNFPADALMFTGKSAPHNAAQLVSHLESYGYPYNVVIKNEDVFVIGRNQKRERSDCIGKKLGGYECSGVILVGNVEEPIFGEVGIKKIIHGSEVFSELTYAVLWSNIEAASMAKGTLKNYIK
ncbi:MAG: hypothetical protein KKE20_06645 [Nanoarchaeota archaeon]|nr:hypothetical protein [Nanoarchaeota archaeon]